MPGGASAGGSPPQSKKFRLRSQSCPARILGSDPDDFFKTSRRNSCEETHRYYYSEDDIAIVDIFTPPPPNDSPLESDQDKSYPSVFDISPAEVQEVLDTVTYRLSELIVIGFLLEAEEQEAAESAKNVD